MLFTRTIRTLPGARALASPARSFSAAQSICQPYKDDMDRNSLKPRSTENTKSSSDAEASEHPDAAFNPNKTRPVEEKDTASQGAEGTPLEASGANQELSKPRGDNPGGASSPPKDKQTKSGGSANNK